MKLTKALRCGSLLVVLSPGIVLAQAFGEYGRALGGATQRQGSAGAKPFGGPRQPERDKIGSPGLGEPARRSLPLRLVVASKEAALYPRQDDEAEKIDRLLQGETLVPMVQIAGGNEWYMVKTHKGIIGWVKSSDVRTETAKNP